MENKIGRQDYDSFLWRLLTDPRTRRIIVSTLLVSLYATACGTSPSHDSNTGSILPTQTTMPEIATSDAAHMLLVTAQASDAEELAWNAFAIQHAEEGSPIIPAIVPGNDFQLLVTVVDLPTHEGRTRVQMDVTPVFVGSELNKDEDPDYNRLVDAFQPVLVFGEAGNETRTEIITEPENNHAVTIITNFPSVSTLSSLEGSFLGFTHTYSITQADGDASDGTRSWFVAVNVNEAGEFFNPIK